MKVIVLAGGFGSRLSEETETKPKPMVEIGHRPILWHILKHYHFYGFNEFYIALGYKGDVIKRYIVDYQTIQGDFSVEVESGKISRFGSEGDNWKVNLIDTGLYTNTGGRVARLKQWLKDSTFMLTYGDAVSNIDLHDLLQFHKTHGRMATIAAVRPPARFGEIILKGDQVAQFNEKPQIGEGWINGGYMVLEPGIFDYIAGDETSLEADVLEHLADNGQLMAFKHDRYWQCMDTKRDHRLLNGLWEGGSPPWKLWE